MEWIKLQLFEGYLLAYNDGCNLFCCGEILIDSSWRAKIVGKDRERFPVSYDWKILFSWNESYGELLKYDVFWSPYYFLKPINLFPIIIVI